MKKKAIAAGALACIFAALLTGAAVIGYQDWQLRGSAPGNPASGFFRTWADNSGQYFKCLTSAGAVCYFDPKATSSTPGIVQTDGSTISNSSGAISCTTATTVQIGCVKPDGTSIMISAGVISAAANTTTTIASGTLALGTSAIASGACATVVTATATGVATTDAIAVNFNSDPTAITGYIPSTNGMLSIIVYPTANTINAKVCNNTGSSITPGSATLNYRVVR